MMRWIVGSSLQFRFLVLAVAVVLMVFGFLRLRSASVDVLPEFAPPFVEIQTEALGLAATEVEALVTLPLEELLTGVPWLQSLRSESVTGLSSIVLFFEPGTDLIRARQMVQERLTQAQGLPSKKVAKAPVMLQPLSATSRVMMVGLSSTELSLIEMSVLARWNIKPRLMGVPGVANVSVWGQRERQLQVQVNPETLKANNVTLDQIIATTGNALWVSPLSFLEASTPGSGGFIDTPNQRLNIRHLLPISTAEDLARVNVDGTSLSLGKVASVVENHQPLIGDSLINNTPGLLLVIEKFPGANTPQVTRGLEEAIEALRPGLQGIDISSALFRPATFIEMALANLRSVLLLSALFVSLILVAFLYNWRSGVISFITIALSFMITLFVLYLRGASLNVMVLAGLLIALSAVIDDAASDVQHIMQRIRQHRLNRSSKSTSSIILEASRETRRATTYATLICLLAAMPFFFMGGLAGSLLQPLVVSYVLAILVSMLVALTVTPALSLMLFRNVPLEPSKLTHETTGASSLSAGTAGRESPFVKNIERAYETFLAPLAARPILALITAGLMVVLAAVLLPQLRQGSLLPTFKERDVLISWTGAPGTSHPAMVEASTGLSSELQAIPGVQTVAAQVGRAITSDEVASINSGKLWVSLEANANYNQTVADIRGVLDNHPDLSSQLMTYTKKVVDDTVTGSSSPVTVRIYGHELDILHAKAEEVRQALGGIGGITSPRVELQTQEDIIEVEVDLAAAQGYGLKPGDVRRAATTLVNSIEVGNLFEEQKVFDVVVVGVPEIRSDLSSIQNLLIDTPSGEQVRLGAVADVRIVPTPNLIKREGVSRSIDVFADVQGRDLAAVTRDVQTALQTIEFPLEYHPEVLGEYAQAQTAQRSLWGFSIAAVIGIFLLLQAAFRSWRLATLVLLALPAAFLGGVLAMLLGGSEVSVVSLVSFLAVLGLATRHSISLIQHYEYLEQVEGQTFSSDLIVRGTRERLAPMLMTGLATLVALLPIVFMGGPGLEVLRPVAAIMVGGLLSTGLLTFFVLPALYLWVKAHPELEFDLGPTAEWLPNVGRAADATD
jgi:CzcA family heavy metal efflux pump